jgi:hypothetical protein
MTGEMQDVKNLKITASSPSLVYDTNINRRSTDVEKGGIFQSTVA